MAEQLPPGVDVAMLEPVRLDVVPVDGRHLTGRSGISPSSEKSSCLLSGQVARRDDQVGGASRRRATARRARERAADLIDDLVERGPCRSRRSPSAPLRRAGSTAREARRRSGTGSSPIRAGRSSSPSSFFLAGGADLCLEPRELVVDLFPAEICASSRSSWLWSPAVKSSSVPASISSSTAPARACICSVLSFARWIASPVSAICSLMPKPRRSAPAPRRPSTGP